MISTVDRYLLREIAESWVAVSAVLLLILIGNSFLFIFRQVGSGDIPPDAIAPFLLSNTVIFLVGIVPFGLYLGVLLGLGRLYRDSEMAALSACGVGGWSLYRPVLLLCLPAALLIAFLTFVANPWAARIEQAAQTGLASRSELSGIEQGRFNESRDGKSVLFVADASSENERMQDIFVHGPDPQGGRGLERARAASEETRFGQRYIVLHDGVRYQGEPGQADYRIIRFARHGLSVPSPNVGEAKLKRVGKTLEQLRESDSPKDFAELHWRLALMAAAVVLALVAVPLSYTTPRQGRYARLTVAVLIYLPYYNLLIVAKNWLRDGTTPPALGLWWVHALPLLLGAILAWRQAGGLARTAARAA